VVARDDDGPRRGGQAIQTLLLQESEQEVEAGPGVMTLPPSDTGVSCESSLTHRGIENRRLCRKRWGGFSDIVRAR